MKNIRTALYLCFFGTLFHMSAIVLLKEKWSKIGLEEVTRGPFQDFENNLFLQTALGPFQNFLGKFTEHSFNPLTSMLFYFLYYFAISALTEKMFPMARSAVFLTSIALISIVSILDMIP